jgi:hypothetical protein
MVELDYNVMEHAQKTVFLYGQQGRVHILLQKVWGVSISVRCWQLVSALTWLVTGLLTRLSRFRFTFLLRAGFCHHIIIELYNRGWQQHDYIVGFEILRAVNVTTSGCDAMWSGRSLSTFRRNILPPSSGSGCKSQKHWWTSTGLHGVTSQKTVILNMNIILVTSKCNTDWCIVLCSVSNSMYSHYRFPLFTINCLIPWQSLSYSQRVIELSDRNFA